MSSSSNNQRCERRDLVASYALAALERSETELMKAHLPTCAECQQEYQALSTVTNTLSAWRDQTLPPLASSWNRLADNVFDPAAKASGGPVARSEEHTSELQSRLHLVC